MKRTKRAVFICFLILLNFLVAGMLIVKAATADKVVVTLTPDPSKNTIKLDWRMNDLSNKTFKVYQKKPGSSEFQTISTTDFESSEEEVKILNIYPENGGENVTFNYKTGGSQTLPKSASLKVWMEGGTMNENGVITSFDNYGRNPSTGKQIIKVTPVSITVFNNNPNMVWNYDVAMFGTWDSNGSQDINQSSVNTLKSYIEGGYGILLGHDTMGYIHPYFNQLSSYFNIDPSNNDRSVWYNGSPESTTGIGGGSGTSRVKIAKEGLFTQFPWKIGAIGTILTAPLSHDLGQKANGDTWLKYTHSNYTQAQMNDPYNYYLTTWNNTAMIQTGHSNCASTEDERKIIANILFYTKQRTTQTTTVDNSAQDLAAPNKVTNLGYTFNGDSSIKVNYTASADNGSNYSYYVKATDRNGTEYNSDISSATITTGVKGYSYVVDQNAGTIPGTNVNTTSTQINVSGLDWKKQNYIHIRAIDNVGNASETTHLKIEDKILPTITVTPNTTSWTKNNVRLTYTAGDNESGFEKMVTGKGEKFTQKTGTYEVGENGNYIFTAYDKAGNTKQTNIQVNNIDKIKPVITQVNQTLTPGKKQVNLEVIAQDKESGIKGYYLTQNKETLGSLQTGNTFSVTKNGMYYFYVEDAVGNISEVKEIMVTTIEIDIVGTLTWKDEENKYGARKTPKIHLYRKAGEEIQEKVASKELIDNLNYSFQVRECNDKGQIYTYWLEEERILGYEPTYQNYDILNELILPEYELEMKTLPVETYQNQFLKNGKIKIETTITVKENKEQVGLTTGKVMVPIDNKIEIEEISIIYNGNLLQDYEMQGNTLVFALEGGNHLLKGDILKISIIGTAKEIGNYKQEAELQGVLQDYRGIPTTISLGTIKQVEKQDIIEYQMPAATLEFIKRDSITEEILTQAEFMLYEWDGEGYKEKETILDNNKEGIYTSSRLEWNHSSEGKYKIVETKVPEYYKDSRFHMEFVIEGLEKEDKIITPNYQDNKQQIVYQAGEPDDLDQEEKIVENEPWKIKTQIALVDSQTKNIIVSEANYKIEEWNKETGNYQTYISKITQEEVKMLRKEDFYLSTEYLYYTKENEGKYRILEEEPPLGYSKEKEPYQINLVENIKAGQIQNGDILKLGEYIEKTRIKANLTLQLEDRESKRKESQGDAKFNTAKYTLYAKEDIFHADGKTGLLYKQGSIVSVQKARENGEITYTDLECGNYELKQTQAPLGYIVEEGIQEIILTADKAQGEDKIEESHTLSVKVKKQGFQLTKVQQGQEGFDVVEGAGFRIYQISNLSIAKEGKIEKIDTNTYALKDEKASQDQRITKKADENGNYAISDLIDYYYKIVYEEDNREKLPTKENVYLPYKIEEELVTEYLEEKEENKIQELYSNAQGYIESPRLAYGDYIVLETSVPKELVAVKPFVISVQKEEIEPQNLEYVIDDNFRAKIKLYEIDKETKNIITQNTAKFVIRNLQTQELVTHEGQGTLENPFIVGQEGNCITPMELEVGNYQIEQIEAPKGYTLPEYEGYSEDGKLVEDKQKPVTIEISTNAVYYVDKLQENSTIVLKQENKSQVGALTLKKEGEYLKRAENKNKIDETKSQVDQYHFIYEKEPTLGNSSRLVATEDILAKDGSGIKLYEKGEALGEYTTNEQGNTFVDNLPLGKYAINETKAGEGFVLKEEELEIEVKNKENEQEAMKNPVVENEYTFTGERQKVEISIKKEDKDTGRVLPMALFGLYTQEGINKEGQEILPKDTLISACRTNEEGIANFSETIPLGKYYLKEIQAPLGYLTNSEKIEVDASYTTDRIQTISISSQTQNKMTQIAIRKIDTQGNYLENAQIQILDHNKNVVKDWYTEKMDQIYYALLTNQTYYLKEIVPAKGYARTKEIAFTIKEDGNIVTDKENIVIEEAGIRILQMKSDTTKLKLQWQEEGTEKLVENIVFQIVNEKGEIDKEITTSKEAVELEKLPIGKYTIHQKEVPHLLGYILMPDQEIEIKDIEEVQEIKLFQGITKIGIQILDDYTNRPIEEKASVIIKEKEGKNQIEWELSKDIKTITKLPIGKYTIEIKGLSTNYEAKEKIIEIKELQEEQKYEMLVKRRIFDLKLEKWIDTTILIENGKESKIDSGYHGEITIKEKPIVKIDILRRKLNNIMIKFDYSIRVTNIGNIAGKVSEITDYLPKGFKVESSLDWVEEKKDNQSIITTKKLEEKELAPNESSVVKVTLKWIGNENDLGEKVNGAEITKAENSYKITDINSVPGNKNKEENDYDEAKAIISIVTGINIRPLHLALIICILTITGLGIYWIKKYVLG